LAPLPLHDALPILRSTGSPRGPRADVLGTPYAVLRPGRRIPTRFPGNGSRASARRWTVRRRDGETRNPGPGARPCRTALHLLSRRRAPRRRDQRRVALAGGAGGRAADRSPRRPRLARRKDRRVKHFLL